jgi:hypothetical protein
MIMMHGVGKERNNLSFSDIGRKRPLPRAHKAERSAEKLHKVCTCYPKHYPVTNKCCGVVVVVVVVVYLSQKLL